MKMRARRELDRQKAKQLADRFPPEAPAFAREVLSFEYWDKQQEIAQALEVFDRVTVQSGHKVGKSSLAASIALWWVSDPINRPRARCVITAPTGRQVKDIIWLEVKNLYRQAAAKGKPLLGKLAQEPGTGLKFPDGREIVGFATDETDRIGGYSGGYLLFIIDEASGVGNDIFEALDGNSAGGAKFLLLGNPLRRSGHFYEANKSAKLKDTYKRFRISSRDTPTARGLKEIKGLATKKWADELLKRWGPKDPRYQVRVLGEYPDQGNNAVIDSSEIREAINRYEATEGSGPLVFGLDPARFGEDEPALCARRGHKTFPIEILPKGDGPALAASCRNFALALAREEGLEVEDDSPLAVFVDVIGIGASAYDALKQYDDIRAVAVNVANASKRPEEYQNLRDELYFEVQEFLKEGGALPDDEELRQELEAHEYDFDRQGRCKVIPKDRIKEAIGRSPNRSDALALSLYKEPDVTYRRLPPKNKYNPMFGRKEHHRR
jgi:phage terminase large subunit